MRTAGRVEDGQAGGLLVTPCEVDADKVRDWLNKGAQPTETVRKLLKTQGIQA